MKKIMVILTAVIIMAATSFSLYAACGSGDSKDMKNGGKCASKSCCDKCPLCVKGTVIAVTNTKDGISIMVTAKDPAAIKEIQDKAGNLSKGCCCGKMCKNDMNNVKGSK